MTVGARILFVTGKGGTGKSDVAAALARECEGRGVRALLVHMKAPGDPGGSGEPRRSPSPLAEQKILDERRDLGDFLTRVLGLAFVARRLQDSRTFSAVAAAAPGLRDLVALTAIVSEARRRRGLVIVDAPATGHSTPMLTAAARVLDLAPFGPVAREARRALDVLRDRRAFAAVLVTTPEELAITEVLGLREQVLAAGVARSEVVINGLWPMVVTEVDGERIAASSASPDAAMHWRRARRQLALVTELEARIGPCARIAYRFTDGAQRGEARATISRSDVASLFDRLAQPGQFEQVEREPK